MSNDTAYVFVGSDRSQDLAVKVLEHSIRRHTSMNVVVRSMADLKLPDPKDIRQGKRTGFSFTRFAIPQLMGYQGRAVYLDADMLVFRDFRELWNIPFDGAKIIIQEELPESIQHHAKKGAPSKRIKQCSVMLLDCAALDWDPLKIIDGLDGQYTYEELLYHMCILDESEIKYGVPFAWNSLEHFEAGTTGLIHYTDMHTQPWVHADNANGYLWHEEVRLMLENGSLTRAELQQEIDLGYFRPSLMVEIDEAGKGPVKPITRDQVARYEAIDKAANYEKHRDVYKAKKARDAAVKAYVARLAREKGPGAAALQGATIAWSSLGDRIGAMRRRLMG